MSGYRKYGPYGKSVPPYRRGGSRFPGPGRAISRVVNTGTVFGELAGLARATRRRAATRKRTSSVTTTKRSIFSDPKIRNDGSSMSFCSFYYPARGRFAKVQRLARTLPIQSYLNTSSERLAFAINTQGVVAFQTYDTTDLAAIFGARTALPAATEHVCMIGCNQEVLISNASNSSCVFDIYDITPRHDIGTGTFETTNVQTPGLAFSTGLVAMGIASGTGAVGSTPFQSDYFTENYHVKKVTRHILGGGCTHRHRQITTVNQYLDQARESATTQVKGLNHWVMIVAHGQPVNDTTTNTLVGTAEGALNIVHTQSYKFTFIDDGAPLALYQNDLDNVVADEMIEEETGAVATVITT